MPVEAWRSVFMHDEHFDGFDLDFDEQQVCDFESLCLQKSEEKR